MYIAAARYARGAETKRPDSFDYSISGTGGRLHRRSMPVPVRLSRVMDIGSCRRACRSLAGAICNPSVSAGPPAFRFASRTTPTARHKPLEHHVTEFRTHPFPYHLHLSRGAGAIARRRVGHLRARLDRRAGRQRHRQDHAGPHRHRAAARRFGHRLPRAGRPGRRLLPAGHGRESGEPERFRERLVAGDAGDPPRSRHRRRLAVAGRHPVGRRSQTAADRVRYGASPGCARTGRADEPCGPADPRTYHRRAAIVPRHRHPRLA